ncbi:MAG: NAD(P)-dependent oxidoreductase [Candidatus Helarchaeota archaeon]|nr:NAD(P)-dependent oxidoreductase [Candidatus Helarchaeota archaeon]
MKVLLTGAFGNIGESTLLALFEKDHEITCLDIKTSKNEKKAEKLSKLEKFSVIWGDITNPDEVNNAVIGIECILHVAGIIPPTSESNPDLTQKVNVEGTKNLINAAENIDPKPKFVFTSSISVHGPRMTSPPPRKADEILNPTDCYTHTKVACEESLKESDLPWTILRLAASPPLKVMSLGSKELDVLYATPLDQRVEFVHTRDVGVALANTVTVDTRHKILLIGGGKQCQMLGREFFQKTLEAYGIGILSDLAFKIPKENKDWYYTDWMDTTAAQNLLQFQKTSFDEYITQLKKQVGRKRYFFKLLSPIIRWYLKRKSPYYKQNKQNSQN